MPISVLTDDLNSVMGPRSRQGIAIGILGQSNERGNVPKISPDITTYPQAFASLRNPCVTVPIGPSVATAGGMFPKVYDDLYDWGYDTHIVNGGIGSMSFVAHGAGVMGLRTGGIVEGIQQRQSAGGADRGMAGTRISPTAPGTGPVWRCTVARNQGAMGTTPNNVIVGQGANYIDYIQTSQEVLKTSGAQFTASISGTVMTVTAMAGAAVIGATDYIYGFGGLFNILLQHTQITSFGTGTGGVGTYNITPSQTVASCALTSSAVDFSSGSVGSTLVDGSITWTMESLTNSAYGGAYNTVFTESQIGMGFDPMGILMRLHEEMQRVQGVSRKFIYMANGQSDVFSSSTTYAAVLVSQANFFLARGYEVMIGLTNFSIGSGTTTQYNTLATGVASAVTTLQAGTWGLKVYAGANLYALLGATGNMGGVTSFTGSITTGVLIAGAPAAGAFEIGQRIATSAGTVIGTITSFGTGTGAAGTYNLTGGVDTASSTMKASGAYMQPVDNVHLNAPGAIAAGGYIASAVKSLLPQIIR